jgi:hypothetical protein
MDVEFAVLVRDWHDFYALVGVAIATLVGRMFVAASIRTTIFSEKAREPMKVFITPTLVHFSIALLICILADHADPNLDDARGLGRMRRPRRFDLFGTVLDSNFPPLRFRD